MRRATRILRCLAAAAFACAFATAAEAVDGQRFDNWTLACDAAPEAPTGRCSIRQERILKDSGQRVFVVNVGYLPDDDTPIALITLPLGIALPPGVMIRIDDGEPVRFPFQVCNLQGCIGGFRLVDDILDQFKKGAEATLTFRDREQVPISVPLSLKGFTAALRALRAQRSS